LSLDPSLSVAVVLIAAGVLALEFRISGAVTEIFAGMLLGFFVQGLIAVEWFNFLAHFGILALMFMAGFEVDVNRIRATWKASVGIGIFSQLVPVAGAFAVCYYLLSLPPKVSLLMGVGLSTTSLALTYQSLKDRNLLGQQSGATLMGAASVVDVLSMVLLAATLGNVGWGTAVFLAFVIPTLIGLPRLSRWVLRRYRGNAVEFEMRFLLMVLLGLGFLSGHAGIHPAIVAFTVGLVLGELAVDHEELEVKLRGIVFSLLAPIFFLHAGAQMNLRVIDLKVAGIAALLFAVVYGLKYLAARVATRLLTSLNGHFAGVLLNYRLTFGIIAASVGLQEGFLDQKLYSVILMGVVASIVLSMYLLQEVQAEVDR